MIDNPHDAGEWLDFIFAYGPFWVYLVLFTACFVENLFPPFPGDSFIAAAGGLVALGRLDLISSFVLAIVGGVMSVMVMYFLGYRYGRRYFIRKDFKYFSAEDIRKFESSLKRWGALLMVFSRFVVGFRSAIALGAGIGRYNPVRMLIFSTISYIMFVGLLFYLMLVVVKNLDEITYYFDAYKYIAWPVVVLAVTMLIVWRIMQVRRSGS